MSTVQSPKTKAPPESQVLRLSAIDWPTYTRLLHILSPWRLRLTYDRGELEIMSPSYLHESSGGFLGRLVEAYTEELGLPIAGGKSTTFRRRGQRKGLEPDECYWIANEHRVRGKTRIDLRVDPPPDLAIEIDVTRSSLDRMAIYAALKVPEVWRFDGQSLTFNELQPDGSYAVTPKSRAFPALSPADLLSFLALQGQMDENTIIRQFRAWIRQRIASGGPAAP
jgi:Uma2 family endonuclease